MPNEFMRCNMEFKDKVAIITGAAGSVGRAIACSFAKNGAKLVLVDLDQKTLDSFADEIANKDTETITFAIDVSKEEQVLHVVQSTIKRFNKIDILVNNAGICKKAPILDITVDEWDNVMAVNLRSVFMFSKEVFRQMKNRKYGKIINVASLAGKIGGILAGAHYSASKAGIICFTKTMAQQAAPYKINVNSICPGPIESKLSEMWGEEAKKDLANKIPFKTFAQPDDIAQTILFLASASAKYITGQSLDVNGGLFMA